MENRELILAPPRSNAPAAYMHTIMLRRTTARLRALVHIRSVTGQDANRARCRNLRPAAAYWMRTDPPMAINCTAVVTRAGAW